MYNGPCKDCPDRHYLCHSECEKYINWKQEREIINELRRKENKLYDDLIKSSRHYHARRRRRHADHSG